MKVIVWDRKKKNKENKPKGPVEALQQDLEGVPESCDLYEGVEDEY